MENYIYMFYDYNDQVIYVGKTGNIWKRMANHFTKGHLPKACYEQVHHIQYAKVGSQFNAEIYETFYIEQFHPKFNTDKKYKEDTKDLSLDFPKPEWKPFYFERVADGIKFLHSGLPYMEADTVIEQADQAIQMNLNIIRYHYYEVERSSVLTDISDVFSKLEEMYTFARENLSSQDCDFSEYLSGDIDDTESSHVIAFAISYTTLPICFGELLKVGLVRYVHDDVFCLPMLCRQIIDSIGAQKA